MNATLTSWLRDASDGWADWMWHISWQLFVLVAVLTVVSLALRGQSARLRHALWLLVLVRLVLPPTTAFPTGYGWWIGPLVSSNFLVTAPDRSMVTAASNAGESASGDFSSSLPVLSWSMILFLLWSGMLAVRLGMLLMAWAQVRSWVARAPRIIDPSLLQMLREVQQRVGWHGHIELRNSEACATPLVLGWWHPVVLLPRTILERLSPAELESVLVHELMHVKRGDGWIRSVQAILESFYFFHPAVWWSSSQLRTLREDACDEATVATLGKRKAYGSALVKAAEILGYVPPPLALGILDSNHPIAQRVHRILDPRLPVAPIGTAKYAMVMSLTALILLPAGKKPAPDSPRDAAQKLAYLKELADFKKRAEPTSSPVANETASSAPPTRPSDQLPAQPSPAEITRLVEQLVEPALRRQTVLDLQSLGPAAESEVIRLLTRADTATRIAAYEVLAVIGNESSKDVLATAYLKRTGSEQFAAQRALTAVISRVRSNAEQVKGSSSSRFFAPQE